MADPTFDEVPKGFKVRNEPSAHRTGPAEPQELELEPGSPTPDPRGAKVSHLPPDDAGDLANPQRPSSEAETGTGSASKLGKIRRDDLKHARS